MHAPPFQGESIRRANLREILRAIRRRRGLRSAEAARAMGMPLRSYQHFESARGRLDQELIHRFASAVNADGHAILLALEIGSVDFAVNCMENKLGTVLVMAVQDFDARGRADVARLDPRSLILAFTRVFEDLLARAREHDAYVERWMIEKSPEQGRADDEDPSPPKA